MWITPRRKAFEPTGVALGSTVTIAGSDIVGQVWSRSRHPKSWWIVTADQRAESVRESDLIVLGQCFDVALFDAA